MSQKNSELDELLPAGVVALDRLKLTCRRDWGQDLDLMAVQNWILALESRLAESQARERALREACAGVILELDLMPFDKCVLLSSRLTAALKEPEVKE